MAKYTEKKVWDGTNPEGKVLNLDCSTMAMTPKLEIVLTGKDNNLQWVRHTQPNSEELTEGMAIEAKGMVIEAEDRFQPKDKKDKKDKKDGNDRDIA